MSGSANLRQYLDENLAGTPAYNALSGYVQVLEVLECLAIAAKALVESQTQAPRGFWDHELVSEPKLTALESALDAAGYGMTDEEFERRLDRLQAAVADVKDSRPQAREAKRERDVDVMVYGCAFTMHTAEGDRRVPPDAVALDAALLPPGNWPVEQLERHRPMSGSQS